MKNRTTGYDRMLLLWGIILLSGLLLVAHADLVIGMKHKWDQRIIGQHKEIVSMGKFSVEYIVHDKANPTPHRTGDCSWSSCTIFEDHPMGFLIGVMEVLLAFLFLPPMLMGAIWRKCK